MYLAISKRGGCVIAALACMRRESAMATIACCPSHTQGGRVLQGLYSQTPAKSLSNKGVAAWCAQSTD